MIDMTKENVLEELRTLIGKRFDKEEVVIAFGDYEEGGESEVMVCETAFKDNLGRIYAAYINEENSVEFNISVSGNVIQNVYLCNSIVPAV